MKKVLFSVFCVFAGLSAFAQQDPQFSQNMYNRLSVNPGYAGSNGTMCGTLIARQQWSGFTGSPKTALLSVDAPSKLLRGGIGGTVISDQQGFEKTMMVKLAYAYRLSLGAGTLGIGADLGVLTKSFSGTWVATDGVANDNAIPQNQNDLTPDFSFGAYYSSREIYVGVSTTHLTAAELKNNKITLARHYYVMAGYNKMVGSDLELRPSILVKTDASSTQLDANFSVMYKNMFWGGASYRVKDAIVPMLGYQKVMTSGSTFRIGYSYDLTTSKIKNYSSGSHELMVGFCMKMEDKDHIQKKKTVRFL